MSVGVDLLKKKGRFCYDLVAGPMPSHSTPITLEFYDIQQGMLYRKSRYHQRKIDGSNEGPSCK